MGLRGISIGSILLVLLIVLLIFGTKRLRHIGGDLGAALRSFRKGIKEPDAESDNSNTENKP